MMMRKRVLWLLAFTLLMAERLQAAEPQATQPPPQIRPVIADRPTLPPVNDNDIISGPAAALATGFLPIVPPHSDDMSDDDVPIQLLPVASNHRLSDDNTTITRAIIYIHDTTRDANGAVAMLAALAGSANQNTLIVAPQFLLQSDITRAAGHLPPDSGKVLAHWGLNAWQDGGDSIVQAPQKSISSFTAVDLLLLYLSDKKAFPALRDIVIAGHGAGADFVLRYAAVGQAPDLIDPLTTIRFGAANASSYLYFTSLRPLNGKPGFALPKDTSCANYNNYKYGLSHLNNYAQSQGADAIRLRYPSRHIVILAGAKSGFDDPFPDTNCAAQMQGPNRFARAQNYDIYISTIFNDAEKTQGFSPVPDAGYDPVAIFSSSCGVNVLFGNGVCKSAIESTSLENSQ